MNREKALLLNINSEVFLRILIEEDRLEEMQLDQNNGGIVQKYYTVDLRGIGNKEEVEELEIEVDMEDK